MSVLRVVQVEGTKRREIEYKCDQCGKIYRGKYQKKYSERKTSFCSYECSHKSRKVGGLVYEKVKQDCLEKYGVKSVFQSKEFKDKCRRTCLEKYGVEYSTQSKDVQEKIKETFIKNYGVDNPWKSKKIQEKIKETWIENYGVDHPLKSEEIQEKIKETCLERYGVDASLKSRHVRDKIEETCLKKYGVDNPYKSEEIRKKIKEKFVENYGVDNPWKSERIRSKIDKKEITRKCHLSMKRNGSYGKSKIEDKFHIFLCEIFGKDEIERQRFTHKWNIDFYVRSIDIYIQFDGVYWHGLDRPIEIIKEFKNPRDEIICETYFRDKRQNVWFEENGFNLLRITDKEFEDDKEKVRSLLLNARR